MIIFYWFTCGVPEEPSSTDKIMVLGILIALIMLLIGVPLLME